MPKDVLESCDSTAQWKRYLNSEDDRVSLDCWKYLHDRVYGKPKQAIEGDLTIDLAVKRVVTDL